MDDGHDATPAAPVRVLMAAIGGYGYHYVKTLLEQVPASRAILAGVVDPEARASAIWPTVEAMRIPVVADMEAFYAAGHAADLAVVVSPIHCHVPQSAIALAHGCHVLCDKPMGATVQEGLALIEAERRARRPVSIGYQWSYSAAIQNLKRDLMAGRFGAPRRFVTLCAWPRGRAYYARNSWAGRLRDPRTNAWVLDSPANNAMAHFLHNACFLLGLEAESSAMPVAVRAELYRALPIESADTAAARVLTDVGCDILFLASHATDRPIEPRFRIECDGAVITFGESGRDIVAESLAGARVSYGDPDATPPFTKLFHAIDRVRTPCPVVCGPRAALAQMCCVNAMHDSVPDIGVFPPGLLEEPDGNHVCVRGLADALTSCYERGALPSESALEWAAAGRTINLRNYARFPGGGRPEDDRDADEDDA
jgi:predicted dehydrogenase